MAVPKKRRSKAKSRTRRASWKIDATELRACPSCGQLTHTHRACMECGQYKGRQVIPIKVKKTASEE
jgi:large subunit ribosomal protein L32